MVTIKHFFFGIMLMALAIIILASCTTQPAPTMTSVVELPTATSSPVRIEPTATPIPVVLGPQAPKTIQPTQVEEVTPTALPSQPRPRVPKVPKVGEEAYDFTALDLQGNNISLSNFRGKKVMLNFWASWCGPCNSEVPHMVKLYKEYKDRGFEVVAVNLREPADTIHSFVQEYLIPFTVLLDEDARTASLYYVRGIPRSIFLDEEGIIVIDHTGSLTEAKLRQCIETLLK